MQFLSPFLYNIFTTDFFKHEVKIPDDKDVLCIWLKDELIQTELVLSKLVGFHRIHTYF